MLAHFQCNSRQVSLPSRTWYSVADHESATGSCPTGGDRFAPYISLICAVGALDAANFLHRQRTAQLSGAMLRVWSSVWDIGQPPSLLWNLKKHPVSSLTNVHCEACEASGNCRYASPLYI